MARSNAPGRFTRFAPLLAALVFPLDAAAALFWDPVTVLTASPGQTIKVYRLATDGERLFAGGVRSSFYVYADFDAVSLDGVSFTAIPPFPLPGVSLSYAAAEGGFYEKLVRVTDDRPPRQYVIARYDAARGDWSNSAVLTLPGDEDPGHLSRFGGVTYLGTTAGRLLALSGDAWSEIPQALAAPAAHAPAPPRVVRIGTALFVASSRGLGRLDAGRVEGAAPALAGRDVADVAADGGGLLVYLRGHGGAFSSVERLTADGAETLARLDAPDARGFVFRAAGTLYAAGGWNEPRALVNGRLLSPRAASADPAYGFRFTTADGRPTPFRGAWYATSSATLHRSRERHVLTVPVVVDAPSAGGGRYETELSFANHADVEVRAELTFHPEGGRDASFTPLRLRLAPRAETRIEDAAAALRAASAAPVGSSLVGSISVALAADDPAASLVEGDVSATARVFTRRGGGESGLFIPALPAGSGVDSGALATRGGLLAGLLRSADTRTNVAAVNAADGSRAPSAHCGGICGRGPELRVADASGASAGKLSFTLSPGARRQWNDVAPEVEGQPPLASAAVRAVPPGGSSWDSQLADDLLVYATPIDRTTEDGAYVGLQIPSRDALRDRLLLPVVGGFSGAEGRRYLTRLLLAQDPEAPASAERLRFELRGGGPAGPIRLVFEETLLAGTSLAVDDVRAWLLARTPVEPPVGSVPASGDFFGALTVSGTSGGPGPVSLAATVLFEITREGVAGRALSAFDALPVSRWARRLAVVSGLRESLAVTSNLTLLNPERDGGATLHATVTIRAAADGSVLRGETPVVLGPGERQQWTAVLAGLGSAVAGIDAYAEIRNLDAGPGAARFVAYGSVLDRATADASILTASKIE